MSEEDNIALKRIILENKEKELKEEIEDIRLNKYGLKKGKKSIEDIKQYFKGIN